MFFCALYGNVFMILRSPLLCVYLWSRLYVFYYVLSPDYLPSMIPPLSCFL